jgi:Cu2+-exporting ATPase
VDRAVEAGPDGRALLCYHCGEALPHTPLQLDVDGEPRGFCCHGCAAAAEWIRQSQLDDYYRLRSAAATRVEDVPDLASWDRDDLLGEHALPVAGGLEITLLTDGMRCAACAWLIDQALQREPGVFDTSANAVTGRIRIGWNPARVRLSQLLGRLAMLGYRPYLATGALRERERVAEQRRWLMRLGIAGLGAMQTMMFSEALYLDFGHHMAAPTRDFFRWVALLVATPVVFFSGWPFLQGCWRELRQRHPGMDTLIASSTLLAYFDSARAASPARRWTRLRGRARPWPCASARMAAGNPYPWRRCRRAISSAWRWARWCLPMGTCSPRKPLLKRPCSPESRGR